jgi:hypothetical protein
MVRVIDCSHVWYPPRITRVCCTRMYSNKIRRENIWCVIIKNYDKYIKNNKLVKYTRPSYKVNTMCTLGVRGRACACTKVASLHVFKMRAGPAVRTRRGVGQHTHTTIPSALFIDIHTASTHTHFWHRPARTHTHTRTLVHLAVHFSAGAFRHTVGARQNEICVHTSSPSRLSLFEGHFLVAFTALTLLHFFKSTFCSHSSFE